MPDASNPASTRGTSYIVACASGFRDRVTRFATRRGASPADLARAVLLLVDS